MGGISKAGLFAGLIFASSILLSSCVSTNAGRPEQIGQTETTVAFSDNDFRMAAELLVEDFANSTAVRNYRSRITIEFSMICIYSQPIVRDCLLGVYLCYRIPNKLLI